MNIHRSLRNLYNNNHLLMNIIVPAIFILVILYVSYNKQIRGYGYASLVLILAFIYIVSEWFSQNNVDDEINSCLIQTSKNKYKKINGLLHNGCFDIYHMSHILLWMLVGVILPNKYITVFMISIMWEVTEHITFKKNGSCKSDICGRYEDILLNMLGYTIGSYLS